jgi:RimJ/RimL family protein N-acetyltransferase
MSSLIRRRAVPGDIPRILEMGEAFTSAVDSPIPYWEEGFEKQIRTFMATSDALLQVLEDPLHGPVGGLGAFAAPHFLFLRPRIASELFWWIEPEYRGSTQALRLLDDYEEWALAQGCEFIVFSMFAPDDKLKRVLEKRGYVHMESALAKGIGPSSSGVQRVIKRAAAKAVDQDD